MLKQQVERMHELREKLSRFPKFLQLEEDVAELQLLEEKHAQFNAALAEVKPNFGGKKMLAKCGNFTLEFRICGPRIQIISYRPEKKEDETNIIFFLIEDEGRLVTHVKIKQNENLYVYPVLNPKCLSAYSMIDHIIRSRAIVVVKNPIEQKVSEFKKNENPVWTDRAGRYSADPNQDFPKPESREMTEMEILSILARADLLVKKVDRQHECFGVSTETYAKLVNISTAMREVLDDWQWEKPEEKK